MYLIFRFLHACPELEAEAGDYAYLDLHAGEASISRIVAGTPLSHLYHLHRRGGLHLVEHDPEIDPNHVSVLLRRVSRQSQQVHLQEESPEAPPDGL